MRRSHSVRVYVVRLVVAVALPLLLFGALLLVRSAHDEQRTLATTVQERAQGAAADLDRELRNLQDLLLILAGSDYLLFGDSAVSRRPALSLLGDPTLGLAVRDLSGEPSFDTCTADGRPLPVPGGLSHALYDANPTKLQISEMVSEPISGEPLLTIDLPIWRDDHSVLILSLCALPRILRILIEQHLPSGWVAVVVDGQGRPIASIREYAGGSFAAAGDDQVAVRSWDNRFDISPVAKLRPWIQRFQSGPSCRMDSGRQCSRRDFFRSGATRPVYPRRSRGRNARPGARACCRYRPTDCRFPDGSYSGSPNLWGAANSLHCRTSASMKPI